MATYLIALQPLWVSVRHPPFFPRAKFRHPPGILGARLVVRKQSSTRFLSMNTIRLLLGAPLSLTFCCPLRCLSMNRTMIGAASGGMGTTAMIVLFLLLHVATNAQSLAGPSTTKMVGCGARFVFDSLVLRREDASFAALGAAPVEDGVAAIADELPHSTYSALGFDGVRPLRQLSLSTTFDISSTSAAAGSTSCVAAWLGPVLPLSVALSDTDQHPILREPTDLERWVVAQGGVRRVTMAVRGFYRRVPAADQGRVCFVAVASSREALERSNAWRTPSWAGRVQYDVTAASGGAKTTVSVTQIFAVGSEPNATRADQLTTSGAPPVGLTDVEVHHIVPSPSSSGREDGAALYFGMPHSDCSSADVFLAVEMALPMSDAAYAVPAIVHAVAIAVCLWCGLAYGSPPFHAIMAAFVAAAIASLTATVLLALHLAVWQHPASLLWFPSGVTYFFCLFLVSTLMIPIATSRHLSRAALATLALKVLEYNLVLAVCIACWLRGFLTLAAITTVALVLHNMVIAGTWSYFMMLLPDEWQSAPTTLGSFLLWFPPSVVFAPFVLAAQVFCIADANSHVGVGRALTLAFVTAASSRSLLALSLPGGVVLLLASLLHTPFFVLFVTWAVIAVWLLTLTMRRYAKLTRDWRLDISGTGMWGAIEKLSLRVKGREVALPPSVLPSHRDGLDVTDSAWKQKGYESTPRRGPSGEGVVADAVAHHLAEDAIRSTLRRRSPSAASSRFPAAHELAQRSLRSVGPVSDAAPSPPPPPPGISTATFIRQNDAGGGWRRQDLSVSGAPAMGIVEPVVFHAVQKPPAGDARGGGPPAAVDHGSSRSTSVLSATARDPWRHVLPRRVPPVEMSTVSHQPPFHEKEGTWADSMFASLPPSSSENRPYRHKVRSSGLVEDPPPYGGQPEEGTTPIRSVNGEFSAMDDSGVGYGDDDAYDDHEDGDNLDYDLDTTTTVDHASHRHNDVL